MPVVTIAWECRMPTSLRCPCCGTLCRVPRLIPAGFPHLVAAACDDGGVRLFGVEGGEPGAQLERQLAKLPDTRLLAAAWHPTTAATLAVAGTDGCIHVLDGVTGGGKGVAVEGVGRAEMGSGGCPDVT